MNLTAMSLMSHGRRIAGRRALLPSWRAWLLAMLPLLAIHFGAVAGHAAESVPQSLQLSVGDSFPLTLHARRLLLGNSRLLSVLRPSADQILLIGQAPGVTSLRVWDAQNVEHRISVSVTALDLRQVLAQAQSLLQNITGLQQRIVGDHVIIDGAPPDQAARDRVQQVAALFPGAIVNLVGKVGWEQTVLMDVRIVELRSLSWRDVGIRWQEDIAGPRIAAAANIAGDAHLRNTTGLADLSATQLAALPARAGAASIYFGIASSLDSRLRLLEQHGEASLLAEPVLSCRSGGSAHFVSGGEIPLPVVNGLGSSNIEYKEYGVILDLQPVVGADGAIFAKIDTELSQLDPSQAVLGVPALLKRRSVTEVNLRAGETLVIAGLTTRARANGSQGLPGLSRKRAAALFGETTRRDERTELAIFITAQVIQAQSGTAPVADAASLNRARQLAEEATRD